MIRVNSSRLFERAKSLFPGGVNSPVRAFRSVKADPFFVAKGEGAYLIDEDNNRYVDFINSWGPLVLGHSHPEVVAAICKQAGRGTSYGACCKLEGDLAEKIIELMPSIEMLRFVSSGTEAVMSAIRLARAYTKRSKVLKFSGCYHGHMDAMLVSAGSGVATLGLPACEGVLESVAQDTLTAQFNNIEQVKEIFSKVGDSIAAIILEPIVGNAGFIRPERGFLKELRSITSKHGALLIFDEVMTGFRVHLGGAHTLFGINPDLIILGKVIGGGLPVGAFGGRREIMRHVAPLGAVYQAGTLSGNPLAMVAGLTTLQIWSSDNNFENTAQATNKLVTKMFDSAKSVDVPLVVDCEGTMFGFFFQAEKVRNFEEAKRSNLDRFTDFFNLSLERGVYFAPSQFEAGFVSCAHIGEPLQYTCQVIEQVLSHISGRL